MIAARLDLIGMMFRIWWRMRRHPCGPDLRRAMWACMRRMHRRRQCAAGAEFTLPSGSPGLCYACVTSTCILFTTHPNFGRIEFPHTFPPIRAVRRDDPFSVTPVPSSEENPDE